MGSFRKASKKASRLRAALCGPPGSGKTFTALRFAMALGKRVCVINTESGAVEKYLGLSPDGVPFDFDIAEMQDFAPTRYTQLIQEAGRDGYDVIIIDSLSHAWAGSGGALELKDKKGGNSFTAWKDITPMHNAMIEAILRSPAHVIATMRTKMEYVIEEEVDPRTGAKKSVPKKVGMEPVQRQGMEYEFDIVADLDQKTHVLTVSKSRCPVVDGATVVKPGAEFIVPVRQWLEDGIAVDPSYYATKPEDLRVVQEERREQDRQEAAAATAEARRQALLAQAYGAPAEQVAAAVTAPAEVASAAVPFTPTQEPATAPVTTASPDQRIVLSNELVSLGAEIGRTPQQINDECKQRLGAGVREIPIEKLQALVNAFRQVRDQARAQVGNAAGNPTAA